MKEVSHVHSGGREKCAVDRLVWARRLTVQARHRSRSFLASPDRQNIVLKLLFSVASPVRPSQSAGKPISLLPGHLARSGYKTSTMLYMKS